MSNIAIFKSGQTPQYLESVNTGEYVIDPNVPKNQVIPKDPDVIINPDISAVKSVNRKYWKRSGDKVVEMTIAEKVQVDLAEKQVQIDAINQYKFDGGELAEILVDKGILTKTEVVDLIKQRRGLL